MPWPFRATRSEAQLSLEALRAATSPAPGEPDEPDETHEPELYVEIRTADQQGRDAYVTGPARGALEAGRRVLVSPWDAEHADERLSVVRRVDTLPGGHTGLLLKRRDVAALRVGDQVSWFPALTA